MPITYLRAAVTFMQTWHQLCGALLGGTVERKGPQNE